MMMVETCGSPFPRRNRTDLLTPAEAAIHQAVLAVEAIGADERLTAAVLLLSQAADKVADVIDERLSR